MMSDKWVPELSLDASAAPEDIVVLLTETLEGFAVDETYRQGVGRAVPGVRDVYGVRVPQLRSLARQLLRTYAKQEGFIQAIAEGCWLEGSREHCVLAILMLAGLKTITPAQRWELGVRYLPDVGDWETCDQLCMGLLGAALVGDPAYMGELESWVDKPNFWHRRAALATTVALRRSTADAEIRRSLDQRTLGICRHLLDDREHYVRKAVDWAVREVIHRDYEVGQAWMLEQSKKPLSSVARSTLKLAAKKLSPQDQQRFLHNIS